MYDRYFINLGLIISVVPKELKGQASSLNIIICNLLGYIPAPFLYGWINDATKISNPKLAMILGILYCFMGFIWCSLAVFFRLRDIKNSENQIKISEDVYQDTIETLKSPIASKLINNKLSVSNLVHMFQAPLGNELIETEIDTNKLTNPHEEDLNEDSSNSSFVLRDPNFIEDNINSKQPDIEKKNQL